MTENKSGMPDGVWVARRSGETTLRVYADIKEAVFAECADASDQDSLLHPYHDAASCAEKMERVREAVTAAKNTPDVERWDSLYSNGWESACDHILAFLDAESKTTGGGG